MNRSVAIKLVLVVLVVLAAIILVFLFSTRERYAIAPSLRIYYDINDVVAMDVLTISDGFVQVYVSNESSTYLQFPYINFSIEYFYSEDWRMLPVNHDIPFPSVMNMLVPHASRSFNISFNRVHHQPEQDGLYRVRLEAFAVSREREPNHPLIIHDIVAEFRYE